MLTISIQAGGDSSRMGRDKAILPFLGEPLIQRVIARVSHLAEEIIVTTNNMDDYRFLGVSLVKDVIPGVGALGGLYTALRAASFPLVYVVACDLPFANADLLDACREILDDTGADAVIPSTEHGLEPLHAIYRKDRCLPAVEAAIKAGKRRMISWHVNADVHILSPQKTLYYDPHGVTFLNLNTPADFQQAEDKARDIEGDHSG
jgi:molybdopterin-guanine dinucleotide biosynthesis protein A